MRSTTLMRTAAPVLALALFGVACGTGGSTAAPPASPIVRAAVDSPAATLRTTLNVLLQEHVFLAADATGAALGGRTEEFNEAAKALDQNSQALAGAVGSVYASAQEAFLQLWRSHIGFFVDYTMAVAAGDQDKADRAVSDLQGYAQDFGAFLAGANPNLSKDAVAELVLHHVLTLKAVVDDQRAGDTEQAFVDLRAAAAHMAMIADPLAAAIVKQFPATFDRS